MDDYIEREALIKTTRETPFTLSMCLTVEECKGMNKAREILADIFEILPAADVQPVRHGRWIETGDFSDEQIDWVACDRCKAIIPDFDYSYCPNCGAKMDGGKE